MTYPRAHLIAPGEPGLHHIVVRCVRRAWLCGFDAETGIDYEHRRQMIYDRLVLLVEIFAIEVWSYAIMSNHYHLVIYVDPPRSQQWNSLEVAERWLRLTQPKLGTQDRERLIRLLALDQERIAVLRERLGSVSWFMRYLNEYIARTANAEDQCKGRFWESRFKSYRLLDEEAVLTAMAYGDLNPFRAGMVTVPEEAEFVSLTRRVEQADDDDGGAARPIEPALGGPRPPVQRLNTTVGGYVALVRYTATKRRHDWPREVGSLFPRPSDWERRFSEQRQRKRRAYGSRRSLALLAERLGQQWLHGMGVPHG